MKRFISLILAALTFVSVFTLVSCSDYQIDLTGKKNIYSDLSKIINNPDKYEGQTIALTSTYTVVYNFSENRIQRHTMVEFDTTGTKRALYEIKKADGAYPSIGSEVTVYGSITKGRYINVESFSGGKAQPTYDLDALDFTADELSDFISDFRQEYSKNEHYGKSVRIFGHLSTLNGYTYLIGLDENGQYLWEIELYDPTGSIAFPTAEGTTVNPVQIIGEMSTYVEDHVTYACIKVSDAVKVESIFKVENNQTILPGN